VRAIENALLSKLNAEKYLARHRIICPKALIQACSLSASRAILGHVLRRMSRALGTIGSEQRAARQFKNLGARWKR
jgi:hypothetical protein